MYAAFITAGVLECFPVLCLQLSAGSLAQQLQMSAKEKAAGKAGAGQVGATSAVRRRSRKPSITTWAPGVADAAAMAENPLAELPSSASMTTPPSALAADVGTNAADPTSTARRKWLSLPALTLTVDYNVRAAKRFAPSE